MKINLKKAVAICCFSIVQSAFCQTSPMVQTKKQKPFKPIIIKKIKEVKKEKIEPLQPLTYSMYELEGKCFLRSFSPADTTVYNTEIIVSETLEFHNAYSNTRLIIIKTPVIAPTTRQDFDKNDSKSTDKKTVLYVDGKSTLEGNQLFFVPDKPEFKKQTFLIDYKRKDDGFIKLINTENKNEYAITECQGAALQMNY